MPTQIINLDELVPDAIEFQYQGKSYILPGDITVKDTFRLQRALTALLEAEGKDKPTPEERADQEKLTFEVEALLLEMFRAHDPDLGDLGFGAVGMRYVLAFVLGKLGFEAVDPPKPGPRKPQDRKPRNGSRRSSTSGS